MECKVNGALAVALRMSQVLGISPVRMTTRSSFVNVRYSVKRDIAGRLFYGFFALHAIVYLTYKMMIEILKQFNTGVQPRLVESAFTICVGVTTIVLAVIVFKGATFTKQLIQMMNIINKIDCDSIGKEKIKRVERNRTNLLCLYVFLQVLLLILDIWMVLPVVLYDGDYSPFIRMLIYCTGYLGVFMQAIRFVFVAMMILTAFQSVNFRLAHLLADFKRNQEIAETTTPAYKSIRDLANTFDTLCDIIRDVDNEYGAIVLATSGLFLTFFGVSAFLLVMCFKGERTHTLGVLLNRNMFDIVFQAIWCIQHFLNLLLMIEPCHRTYVEMQITQSYINRIMYCVQTTRGSSRLSNELEMFFRMVATNNALYSPLELSKLDRLFLTKIFVGAMSYIVIVLQFQVEG